MAEKFNTEQEVCLQIPSARGDMQVKEGHLWVSSTYVGQLRGTSKVPQKLTESPYYEDFNGSAELRRSELVIEYTL
jgi:hypothetical protein